MIDERLATVTIEEIDARITTLKNELADLKTLRQRLLKPRKASFRTAAERHADSIVRWKRVIQLRNNGMTFKQIAAAEGISTARARTLVMAAQRWLKSEEGRQWPSLLPRPIAIVSSPKNAERLLRSVAQLDATDSRILSEVHEAAKDLHEAGAIDDSVMRRFDRQMEAAGKIMREDRNVLRNLSDQPIQLPASDHYTYRVSWSPGDGEYVATCAEFPSLSWLDKDEVAALTALRSLIKEAVKDLGAKR